MNEIKKEAKIGNSWVEANVYKNRINFWVGPKGRYGGACWDMEKKEWIKIKNEVGAAFKVAIAEVWGL